ncbi:HNH endonuclease signature motif containing protein [Enterobacter sp. Bisph1]|uniref:HNH endonuclease signature motif containing protein n=1 Tax=Enterobacter sp. Bisph1 TaxID=1274399 RepID=UPI00057C0866|nr:HNH endonuclease signature motif containing protein [Enterobacter sp. Bisph1]
MSFSLPGFHLFYLSRDNLEPEKYELIARPSVTWDYIQQEFEFDDHYRDHYYVEGLRPRSWHSRNYAYQHHHNRGINTENRVRYLVFRGDVVMLRSSGSPGELFYIDDKGELLCKHHWLFKSGGVENILKEYRNSLGCRYYRNGKPRPTSFALPFSGGITAPASNQKYQKINSKAAGRLLAAGGVYNGNVEGFRKTAEQLGGDAVKGYDQVLNEQTAGTAIAAASILLAKRPIELGEVQDITKFVGKVRGDSVLLQNVEVTQINYVKRTAEETAILRKEFNSTVRKSFLKDLSNSPEAMNKFSPEMLERMSIGRNPEGWQVHHKLPLDDSGTNAFDNLILMKNDPYHQALTNYQFNMTRDMMTGESKIVPWVKPQGSIYPK